jgi:low affinity Fe/Cu permease
MTTNNSTQNLSNNQVKKLIAVAIIITILVVFIAYLPARYNKDYTGLGKVIGFSRLYQDHNEVDKKLKEIQKEKRSDNN